MHKNLDELPAIILAGGEGRRMCLGGPSQNSKPLVELGGTPMLIYILFYLKAHGISEIYVCAGANFTELQAYFQERPSQVFPWLEDIRVTVLDTGKSTGSEARLGMAFGEICKQGPVKDVVVSYCDIVSEVDLKDFLTQHRRGQSLVTMLSVPERSDYGVIIEMDGDRVTRFAEKKVMQTMINGGLFIFRADSGSKLATKNEASLERDLLPRLAEGGQLSAYEHKGFWHVLNSPKDLDNLEALIDAGKVPGWFSQLY